MKLSRISAAEPATASSAQRRRTKRRTPPWIEERAVREQQIIAKAADLGIQPPARPGTRAHARSLEPAIQQLREVYRKAIIDDPNIPF